MATADKLKEAMQYCITNGLCSNCPIYSRHCNILGDALAYINRLEKQLAERNALLAVLGVSVPDKKE